MFMRLNEENKLSTAREAHTQTISSVITLKISLNKCFDIGGGSATIFKREIKESKKGAFPKVC